MSAESFRPESEAAEDKSDAQDKKPANRPRWTRPLLPVDRVNQSPVFERPTVRPEVPRAPLEALLVAKSAEKAAESKEADDDDEEEDDDKPQAAPAAPPAKSEAEEVAAEAALTYDVEHSVAEAAEGELPLHAPETPPLEAAAEETMAQAEDDQPPLTPLGPDAPEQPAFTTPEETEEDKPAATVGGSTPPPTSHGLFGSNAAPDPHDRSGNYHSYSQHNAPPLVIERLKTVEKKSSSKLQLLAAFLAGYVVKDHLERKKRERREAAYQTEEGRRSDQEIRTTAERQRLERAVHEQASSIRRLQQNEKVFATQAARREKHGEMPGPVPEVVRAAELDPDQMFDQEGNRIVLQPGWRAERSAGGYITVLDEHNRVVHEAVRYGREFQMDQKREQLSASLFGVDDATAAALGGGLLTDGQQQPGQMPADVSAPGQVPYPSPAPQVDLRHRLPEPRNQFVAAAASPWLWLALASLLIIYFLAALA